MSFLNRLPCFLRRPAAWSLTRSWARNDCEFRVCRWESQNYIFCKLKILDDICRALNESWVKWAVPRLQVKHAPTCYPGNPRVVDPLVPDIQHLLGGSGSGIALHITSHEAQSNKEGSSDKIAANRYQGATKKHVSWEMRKLVHSKVTVVQDKKREGQKDFISKPWKFQIPIDW